MTGMMHTILMISLDPTLRDPASESFRRHSALATLAGQLTILIPGVGRPQTAGSLTVHPLGDLPGGQAMLPLAALYAARRLPRPDLIVTQDVFVSGLAGLLLRHRFGSPVLAQNHTWLFGNTAWLNEQPRRNRLLLRLAHFVRRYIDYYRTVNERERDAWIAAGGDADRAAVLPLGTASAAFSAPVDAARLAVLRLDLGVPPGAPVVLWVGYPHPVKRVPLLLTTFQAVVGHVTGCHLVLVGDTALSAVDLPGLAADLGIADRVHFAGSRPFTDLPAFYQMADLYVHTSSYEGVPRVLIEAGAAGCPVVALDTVGADAVVVPGTTGLLVPDTPDAVSAMAAQIAALLADPARRQRMGAAAQDHCLAHFNADDYPARWVAIWRQAIAQGRRP